MQIGVTIGARLAVLLAGAIAIACSTARVEPLGRQRSAVIGGKVELGHTEVFALTAYTTSIPALCTATLIAPNLMLTARHCVTKFNGSLAVHCEDDVFGRVLALNEMSFTNEASFEDDSRWYYAEQVLVGEPDARFCGGDLALVILNESVAPDVATPVAPRFEPALSVGEKYSAVGYGATDNVLANAVYGVRHSLDDRTVSCIGFEGCDMRSASAEFEAESGACEGDSGGPALDTAGNVIGVLSRSHEECTVGVYTNVQFFESFILDGMAQAKASAEAHAAEQEAKLEEEPAASPEPAADAGSSLELRQGPALLSEEGACSLSNSGASPSRRFAMGWLSLFYMLIVLRRRGCEKFA